VVIPSLTANEVIPYLNNGSGTLSAGTAVAVGAKPVAVIAGDFNRDGKLDIIVSNWDADTIGVLTGVGDGTFNAMAAVAVGDKPAGLAALDINKDGDLDLVVANYGADNVQLLSNNGSGTMTAGATTATGTGPASVVAGDWDRDGDQDIAVTNWGGGTITVLATAAGALGADETITVGTNPLGLVAADFNSDGMLDLAAANYGDGDVSVSLNGGAAFGAKTDTAVGTNPAGIAAVRWNAGGSLDLVISNSGSDNYSVLSGVGDGTFGAAANTALGSTDPSGVAIGDFNRNGEPDVVFMYSTGATATALASGSGTTGDGTFTVSQTLSFAAGSNGPENINFADMDRDGDLDMVVGEANLDAIYVSLNDGTGTFGALTGTSLNAVGGVQSVGDIVTGDFDNDGDIDVVVSHANGPQYYSYFSNDGSANLTLSSRTNTGRYVKAVSQIPADIDRDGDLDWIGDDSNNGETVVYLNDGTGTFTAASAGVSYAYYGLRDFALADVSRDGIVDLLFLEIANDIIGRGNGTGSGTFGAASTYSTSSGAHNPLGMDLADYDRDGDLDYAAANSATTNFGVGLNDGSGAFGAVATFTAADALNTPSEIVSGDFDSDGDIDIALSSYGNDYVYIFSNNGSASFTYTSRVAVGDGPLGLAIGDVNKDGKLDWATTNSNTANPSTISIGTGN